MDNGHNLSLAGLGLIRCNILHGMKVSRIEVKVELGIMNRNKREANYRYGTVINCIRSL